MIAPPTTDAMHARALELTEEILRGLADQAFVAMQEGESLDVLVRSAYERLVQQVFPLVAATTVMDAVASLAAETDVWVQEVAVAVEGLVPTPSTELEGQLSIDEVEL